MNRKSNICLILLGIYIFVRCTAITEISRQRVIKGPKFSPYEGLKTSIAVLDFKNYTNQGGARFGSAVADMLISLLVRSGRFVVIERQRIQEILREQAIGQSGAITEETAPQVGKLLGVQSLILGDILEVSRETRSHKFKKNKDKDKKQDWQFALKAAVGYVKLHYRMVNTATGEIVIADNISGTEIRPGLGIKTKDFDFEDMFEFDQTVLGIATRKAINKMAKNIVQNVRKVKWVGKIVQVKDDDIIYFTPGRNSGVRIGAMFKIFGNSQEMENNELSILELSEKGTIKVVGFVGDKVAKAVVVQGGSFNRGDQVRAINVTPL